MIIWQSPHFASPGLKKTFGIVLSGAKKGNLRTSPGENGAVIIVSENSAFAFVSIWAIRPVSGEPIGVMSLAAQLPGHDFQPDAGEVTSCMLSRIRDWLPRV
jgi:hypothetical protein